MAPTGNIAMVENGANHPCSSLLDEFATEVERMTRLLTEAISKAGKGEIETAFTTLHQSLKEQQEATLKSESGADLLSATEKDALQDAMRMTIADYLADEIPLEPKKTFLTIIVGVAFRLVTSKVVDDSLLPLMLLDDILDYLPCSESDIGASLLEHYIDPIMTHCLPHVPVSKDNPSESKKIACRLKCLNLTITLVRRLSPSLHANVVGRIFFFLSRTLDLFDRSGFNNKMNVNDVDFYKENPSASSVLAEQYQILEDSSAASSEFCEKFWSLQQLLRSEGVVEGGKSKWSEIVSKMGEVLSAFEGLPVRPPPAGDGESSVSDDVEMKDEDAVGQGVEGGTVPPLPSHLLRAFVSRDLIWHQMGDSFFRRAILLQCLFFLQHVGTLARSTTLQQQIAGKYKLSDQELQLIDGLEGRCITCLRKTYPQGDSFVESIIATVEREKNYIQCKAVKAVPKPFYRSSVLPYAKKARTGPLDPTAPDVLNMGEPELTKLWSLSQDNLECFKEQRYYYVPNFDTLFQPVFEEIGSGIEDEYKLKCQGSFRWKALRLISRQKLSYQLKPKESKIVKDLDCVRELHDPAYVAKDKSNTVEPGLELPAAEAEKSEEQGEGEEMKSGTILVVKQEAEPETGSRKRKEPPV